MTGDPTTYSVVFELTRAQMLTANDRKNWRAAAPIIAALRTIGARGYGHSDIPQMDRAHVSVHVSWPDLRKRDVANLAPTAKALVDGMVTGPAGAEFGWLGLLPDDDDLHLIGPHLYPSYRLSGIAGVTVLRFDFVPLEVVA